MRRHVRVSPTLNGEEAASAKAAPSGMRVATRHHSNGRTAPAQCAESRRKAPYPVSLGFKGDPQGPGAEGARYYADQVKGRRRQVLDALGDQPGTAEEIGERCGLHWYLTRPRLSELKAMGLVIETGARGRGALGGSVSVWRQTTGEERAAFAAMAHNPTAGAAHE